MDEIYELLASESAIEKLGRRGISATEAEQLPRNAHDTTQNPRGGQGAKRRLLIGHTDDGRALTLVIERTIDPTTWLIITGWPSTDRERRILER